MHVKQILVSSKIIFCFS